MIEIEFDNGYVTNCELVLSYSKKITGLRNFTKLDSGCGLWFTFDEPDYYMFWNKGVDFPIDILFINDMEVNTVATLEADSSRIVMPMVKSEFVVEINKGVAKEAEIRVGSKVVKIRNK
jgi:uncharacterized membrane protein (UPF0127 family)